MYCSAEDTSLCDFYTITLILAALRQSTKIKIHWKIIIRQEKENFLSSRETRNWKRFSEPNTVFYQRFWFKKQNSLKIKWVITFHAGLAAKVNLNGSAWNILQNLIAKGQLFPFSLSRLMLCWLYNMYIYAIINGAIVYRPIIYFANLFTLSQCCHVLRVSRSSNSIQFHFNSNRCLRKISFSFNRFKVSNVQLKTNKF